MSENPGRKVLLLSVRGLVFLIAFAALWMWARPAYNSALAGALDLVLPVLESPELTERVTTSRGDLLVHCQTLSATPVRFHGDFHFGNLIFAALLFATLPHASVVRRFVILAVGMVVLFLLNVLEMYFYVETFYVFPGNLVDFLIQCGEPRGIARNLARNVASSVNIPRGILAMVGIEPREFFDQGSAVMKLGERVFPLLLWVIAHLAFRKSHLKPEAPPDR